MIQIIYSLFVLTCNILKYKPLEQWCPTLCHSWDSKMNWTTQVF